MSRTDLSGVIPVSDAMALLTLRSLFNESFRILFNVPEPFEHVRKICILQ